MPLIVLDDVCPLCERGFFEGEDAYAAWGLFCTGELARFCGTAMHWDCYLAWDRRAEFARRSVDAWRVRSAESVEHHRVMESDRVHVSLHHGHAGSGEVVLLLKELGYDLRVAFEDWDWWLKLPPAGVHSAVAAQWEAVRNSVRAALPSLAMIQGNYPPLPENRTVDCVPAGGGNVYSEAVRKDRWKEVLAFHKDGLDRTYWRRLIEYVSYYPDDEAAAERLRDERPWVDRYVFEARPLSLNREAGLLWVLIGGWPKPTDPALRQTAGEFLRSIVAAFPDTRAAGYADKLMSRWSLAE